MNATMKLEAGLSLRQSAAEAAREAAKYLTLIGRTLFGAQVSMAVLVAVCVALMAAVCMIDNEVQLERTITNIGLAAMPWGIVWALKPESEKGGMA